MTKKMARAISKTQMSDPGPSWPSCFYPQPNKCFWGYTGISLSICQCGRTSVCLCVHPCVCTSVYKILISVKALAGLIKSHLVTALVLT